MLEDSSEVVTPLVGSAELDDDDDEESSPTPEVEAVVVCGLVWPTELDPSEVPKSTSPVVDDASALSDTAASQAVATSNEPRSRRCRVFT